jgi:hypothetical protein
MRCCAAHFRLQCDLYTWHIRKHNLKVKMNGSINPGLFWGTFLLVVSALAIMVSKKDYSLLPPPKPRDFGHTLAAWAAQRGFRYTPQQVTAISGTYHNRWFTIHTRNAENALEIHMRLRNAQRHRLQIFADWLEESGVSAFINRFRIYSTPPGLGESLFDTGSSLREALSNFPCLRARLELACDPINKDELRYSLLTDLPTPDLLESIMGSMKSFCEAFEQAKT